MNKLEVVEGYFYENEMIVVRDLIKLDVSKYFIYKFIKENNLVKVSKGIYINDSTSADKMYLLQMKYPRIVFSHETALYLHGLIDRDPLAYSVAVPNGYNATKLSRENVIVRYLDKNYADIGLGNKATVFGNEVYVYDKEKTICDMLKIETKVEKSVLTEGIKNYLNSKDRDLQRINKYARKMKVEKKLKLYLRIIL